MIDELPEEVPESADGWRRLHPLTILKEIGSLAWALVAAIVLDFEPVEVPGNWAEADVVIAVGVFVYAIARYVFTTYRSRRPRWSSVGVCREVPPGDAGTAVQSVAANAGFVGRLFGLTTVDGVCGRRRGHPTRVRLGGGC